MGRKRIRVGTMKKSHSYKTKKRLEIKRIMLAKRAQKNRKQRK